MARWLLLPPSIPVLLVNPGYAGHEDLGCGTCHIAHMPGGASDGSLRGGLWNTRRTTGDPPVFTLYSSPTFDALDTDIRQPDGPSKFCLGCHDGSYSGFASDPSRRMTFGVNDLARSHPISFTYDSALAGRVRDGSLRDPVVAPSGLGGTIATDLLDAEGKVQCTSCHDVHSSGNGTKLLRYDPTSSELCLVCHNR